MRTGVVPFQCAENICTGGASVSTRTLVRINSSGLAAFAKDIPTGIYKPIRRSETCVYYNPRKRSELHDIRGRFMGMRVWVTAAVLIFVLCFGQMPAGAWGNEGHTWINAVAATKMPKSMPSFFGKAADRLGFLGPEPDRWRNQNSEPELKYSQEADHFIDMERIPADFGEFPIGRYGFMKKLYEKRASMLTAGVPQKEADDLLPDRVGMQPYITMEVFERMKVAFRDYRKAKLEGKNTKGIEGNIILYAGWLGHYVADGSQPLHTTVKYDGWMGENPNGYVTKHGIHSDFETRFVKENVLPKNFSGLVHMATELKNPRQDYIAYLKESNSLVEPLYKLEKAGGFAGKGSPEANQFVNERLAAGAQMLANLWYTAWVESAVEPPDPYAEKKAATAAKTN